MIVSSGPLCPDWKWANCLPVSDGHFHCCSGSLMTAHVSGLVQTHSNYTVVMEETPSSTQTGRLLPLRAPALTATEPGGPVHTSTCGSLPERSRPALLLPFMAPITGIWGYQDKRGESREKCVLGPKQRSTLLFLAQQSSSGRG